MKTINDAIKVIIENIDLISGVKRIRKDCYCFVYDFKYLFNITMTNVSYEIGYIPNLEDAKPIKTWDDLFNCDRKIYYSNKSLNSELCQLLATLLEVVKYRENDMDKVLKDIVENSRFSHGQ